MSRERSANNKILSFQRGLYKMGWRGGTIPLQEGRRQSPWDCGERVGGSLSHCCFLKTRIGCGEEGGEETEPDC